MKHSPEIPSNQNNGGYAHPKCYLKHTNNCSKKISGEHYISNNLLRRIKRENNKVAVSGPSLLPNAQSRPEFVNFFRKRILCVDHNSALHHFDDSIGEFIDAINAIDEKFGQNSLQNLEYQVDGTNLERWILKTLLGLSHAGQLTGVNDKPLNFDTERFLKLLCMSDAKWPNGWGLYVRQPPSNEKVYHAYSFSWNTEFDEVTNELYGLAIVLNGFHMYFFCGGLRRKRNFGVRRPIRMVMKAGSATAQISFNWRHKAAGQEVAYIRCGTYQYKDSPPEQALIPIL